MKRIYCDMCNDEITHTAEYPFVKQVFLGGINFEVVTVIKRKNSQFLGDICKPCVDEIIRFALKI